MKYWRSLFLLAVLLVCIAVSSICASAFDMTDVAAPDSATKLVYGYSGANRELVAYRFGNGENVLVAGFAIHGYEDNFPKDGGALVYTANALMQRLDQNRSLLTDYGWTVYILPCMNPDGLQDGYTCDGPGRCTTTYINANGELVKGTGIDLNRAFPHNWTQYTGTRNFNGSQPLAAREAQALAEFMQSVKGNGVNLCIDTHGWYHQIITSNGMDSKLYQIFAEQFPGSSYANCTNSKGYFTSYTTALGYTSCLFEFPGDVYSMNDFLSRGYCEKYHSCILSLLKAYGSDNGHSKTCASKKFTDVIPWAWYHGAVDYVLDAGIFNGISETAFAPNQNMTRAMLVTTLWRMSKDSEMGVLSAEDVPEEDDHTLSFSDVAPAQWYTDAVLWAAENGIVTGFPDGTFAPNDPLTREQLTTIFYRHALWQGKNVETDAILDSFPDASTVSDYAQKAMRWAYGVGLVQGISDGGANVTLSPKGTATRAQTATIIMRYLQMPAKSQNLKLPHPIAVEPNISEAFDDLGGN